MLAFEILGPLAVRGDHGEIRVPGARRRALLVRLLVSANDLVPASRLAEDLWDGAPPAAAASTLQSHMSLLRKALGQGRLVGRSGGYMLEAADDELDVCQFETETRRGRAALASGDAAAASHMLGTALHRWRGVALADVTGAAWALPEQTRLEELHLVAIESWLDARLELGEHHEVAAVAESTVADHPLREEIWRCLMLALYRSGRQSEALRAYQRLRTLLGEELGIEPSAQLVALDDAIVQQKTELDWSGPRGARNAAWRWLQAGPSGSSVVQAGPGLPSGTVTLLFTDIEGSTHLWEGNPVDMGTALVRHDDILRTAVAEAGGHVFKTVGDAVCAAFATSRQALAAAVRAQRSLGVEKWPGGTPVQVRMGVHTGACQERDGDYFGPTVNRTARLTSTAHGGQIVVSSVSAQLLGDDLPTDLSLLDLGQHTLKDLARPEHVFQVVAHGIEREFPPLRSQSPAAGLHNLPAEVSSFVGRDGLLADIRNELESSRLVTLTGPGGAGKTRMALHAGAQLVHTRRDGVWLIDLAPASDSATVARTVARVLRVREEPDQPLEQTLTTSLSGRQLILVFDNCEQVLEAAALLAGSLVAECHELAILATSREPLGIFGESVILVPSMTMPPEGVIDPHIIDSCESTRLFVERTTEHQTEFALSEANAPVVASICRRLDGIPLAIELAAVRTRSLSIDEIDARLNDRFRLLTGGSRTAPPRHQTLRAAIDWSYDLLSPAEQAVLRRLSVFGGGWNLEEAEEVTIGDDVEHAEVLDLLSTLVDKSLILCDTSTTHSRYKLLESVRHYAADRLTDHGEAEANAARVAHSQAFLALAERAAPHLHGARQQQWLDRLEMDHENLRASLRRLVTEPASATDALRMGVALQMFWLGRGYNSEGAEYLTMMLEDPHAHDRSTLRGAAHDALGHLLMRQGKHDDAKAHFDEALAIARRMNDVALEAAVLTALAWITYIQGAEATSLADEAVAVARRSADPRLIAVALERRADVASTDHLENARADYSEALSRFRSIGDESSGGEVLNNLGGLELNAGDLDGAKSHLDDALDILVESKRVDALPATLFNLGVLSFLQGNVVEAQVYFLDSMMAAKDIAMTVVVGYALLGLALCATGFGKHERGATLHGAADALFVLLGVVVQPLEDSLRTTDQSRLRDIMPRDSFMTAYDAGRSLTVAEAVEVALRARTSSHGESLD